MSDSRGFDPQARNMSDKRRALAAKLARGERLHVTRPTLTRRRTDPPPLSYTQEALWWFDKTMTETHGAIALRNQWLLLRIEGPLDVRAMRAAFEELVRRHENLRTSFHVIDDEPVVRIDRDPAVDLPVVDLSHLAEHQAVEEARRRASTECERPIRLDDPPLVRPRIFRIRDDLHILFLLIDHILFDGWSFGIVVKEITALYLSLASGRTPQLPELPVQYGDFAVWEREHFRGKELDRLLEYWCGHLGGDVPYAVFPSDRPRGDIRIQHEYWRMSAQTSDLARNFGATQGSSLFVTLFGAWQILLYRLSGKTDICVATSVANRIHPETHGLIGGFANTIVLRNEFSGSDSFEEALSGVRKATLGGLAHQELPMYLLEKELPGLGDYASTVLGLQNYPNPEMKLPGFDIQLLGMSFGPSTFDITVTFVEDAGGLVSTVDYNAVLFDRSSVLRLMESYQRLLAAALTDPKRPIDSLPL